MSRKGKKGRVACWLRETSETHQPNAMCGHTVQIQCQRNQLLKEYLWDNQENPNARYLMVLRNFCSPFRTIKVLWWDFFKKHPYLLEISIQVFVAKIIGLDRICSSKWYGGKGKWGKLDETVLAICRQQMKLFDGSTGFISSLSYFYVWNVL